MNVSALLRKTVLRMLLAFTLTELTELIQQWSPKTRFQLLDSHDSPTMHTGLFDSSKETFLKKTP